MDSPNCDWVVSEEILAEYQDVLSRKKFKLTDEVRKEWLDVIDLVTKLVDVQITIDFARDRKDEKFLACAVAAEADFLITGDADFNEAQNLVNTTIVSVSMFKRLVCDFPNLYELLDSDFFEYQILTRFLFLQSNDFLYVLLTLVVLIQGNLIFP